MALEVTDLTFEELVLKSNKLTMVDFWAEWCGPCRIIGPIVEELGRENSSTVNVCKMDVDNSPSTPTKFGIRGIPTILFFKDGEMIDKSVGAVPKAKLEAILKKHLEVDNF